MLSKMKHRKVYIFTESELTTLLEATVLIETGVHVKLEVGYCEEMSTDVYIKVRDCEDEDLELDCEDQLRRIDQLNGLLSLEEWFVNRDNLLRALTDTDDAYFEWRDEGDGETIYLLWVNGD